MATAEGSHRRREDCDKEEDSRPQCPRQDVQGRELASVVSITNLALHPILHPDAQGREVASVVGITNHVLHPNLHPGFMTGATVTGEVNMSRGLSKLPVLLIERDHSTEERSVFDLSTKKFHVIKNPDFLDAKCICGRGEWLLMCREAAVRDCWFTLFLLNPVSGVKVELPTVHGVLRGPSTFSLSSGYPDLIITGTTHFRRGVFTLRIMRAGDEAWEEYSIEGIQNTVINRVALAGRRVLCVDYRGRVIVFDLLERSLRYFTNLKPCLRGFHSVIECDGEVVMADSTKPMFRYFRFMRFDWGLMSWVEVDERELRNASWFMDSPSACMRTCEGMKVYTLMPNENGSPNPPDYHATKCFRTSTRRFDMDSMFNIYMHNLVCCPDDPLLATAYLEKETTESLMSEDVRAMSARWVDADILC